MEVHTHTHTARKKFKHYVWEFLMLFLAVFCGFLAENFREHQIEHKREKKYMFTLLSDLAADTNNLNTAIPRKEKRINSIDTVFNYFIAHPGAKTISGKIFRALRRTNYDARFTRTNITFNQLENAGGMRLIRQKDVADSISAYDLHCEQMAMYFDLYMLNSQIGNRQFEHLFTAADLLPYYISNTTEGIVSNIPDSITIRINTENLNDQLNFLMQEKAYARQEIARFTFLRERAERLMNMIKSKYHIP